MAPPKSMIWELQHLHEITPMTGLITPASMLAMAVTFTVLGIFLTTVRFITRRMQKILLGWDDWFIIPALVLMLAMCANMIVAVAMQRFGYRLPPRLGKSGLPDLSGGWAPEVAQAAMFEYIQEIIAPFQLACAKFSVVFFYRRILVAHTRGLFHWITIVLVVLISLWALGLGLVFIFPCGLRFSLYWDGPNRDAVAMCTTPTAESVLVISDVALDAIIFVLPAPAVMRLQLSLRKKLLVVATFAVGALTIAAAAVRLSMIFATESAYDDEHFTSTDEAPEISVATYWGLLESGLSVVVACLPALQYLITRKGPAQLVRTVTDGIRSVSRLGRSSSSSSPGSTMHSESKSALVSHASSPGSSPRIMSPGSTPGSTPGGRSRASVVLARPGPAFAATNNATRAVTPTVDVEKANQGARHIGLVAMRSPKSVMLAMAIRSASAAPPQTPLSAKSNASASTSTTVTYMEHRESYSSGGGHDRAADAGLIPVVVDEYDVQLPPLPPPPYSPRSPRSPHTPFTPVTPYTPFGPSGRMSAVSALDDRASVAESEVKIHWI